MVRTTRSTVAVGVAALVLGAALVGAGVVVAGAGDAGATATESGQASNGRTITVSAAGEADAAPDEAVVRVSIEATADDPTVARRRVAENASSMREAIVELGLDESAIRTTGYNIYEDRVRPDERGGEPETTYRARHSFRIRIDDTDRVGEVIDAAVEGGATNVGGVEFTLSTETRSQLRREAIQAAMANARSQAEAIAGSGGMTVGDVRTVRTGATPGPRPVPRFEAAADGGGGTAIESGPVTVRATVTVTYDATGGR